MMNGIKYDMAKRTKAGKGAILRAVVGAYIAYLAFKVFFAEDTTMSVTLCRIIGIVFIAADIAFIVYSYNLFQREMKDAVITEEAPEAIEESDDSEEEE